MYHAPVLKTERKGAQQGNRNETAQTPKGISSFMSNYLQLVQRNFNDMNGRNLEF